MKIQHTVKFEISFEIFQIPLNVNLESNFDSLQINSHLCLKERNFTEKKAQFQCNKCFVSSYNYDSMEMLKKKICC